MASVLSVNVVHAVIPDPSTPHDVTAIDKRPVHGPVDVGLLSVAGDMFCDMKNHGGPEQAVYAYADEDRAWWAAELSRQIAPGRFGENLTTRGVDVTRAVIGEQWRIGTVRLQVTTPRIPCTTFAGFWQVPDLVKRFTAHGAPGAYLRVVEAGRLEAGDEIDIAHRPDHGLTIGDIFAARAGARDRIALIATAADVTESNRVWAQRLLNSAGARDGS